MPVTRYLCISTNVGLGEAAKRDVGTGENQIPDMSSWKRNPSSNRWRKLPDGTII
ncbi:gp53-like domain-containing protein, partial [Escherichia coli]